MESSTVRNADEAGSPFRFKNADALRAIRRDAENRIGRLFAVLWETIGPLHGIHEKSQLTDFPLIDVVHKDDLDKIEKA